MNTIKPPKLNKGDTVGIVSPAYPVVLEHSKGKNVYYDYGKAEIEKMGFTVKESPNLMKRKWWSGGSVEERVQDLLGMYEKKNVKAIFAQNGGHTCMDLLDRLDYDLIANNPKPLFGFSDITNLLIAIFAKTGQVGFHSSLSTYNYGWMWRDYIKNEKGIEQKMFLDVLTKAKPFGGIPLSKNWDVYNKGSAEGMLFGGNLSMLNFLIGTEYFPRINDLKGAILFWEIDNVKTYRIYKTLLQFKYHGLLDVISGMVIGRNAEISGSTYDEYVEPSQEEVVKEVLRDYDFPIISNVDFGHLGLNLVMPIGVKAQMDTSRKTIELIEPAVV